MPTRRQEILAFLEIGEHTLRDVAAEFELTVKGAQEDVRHVRHSAGKRFRLRPAECSSCGFVFRRRQRLTTPSRCPECRSERVEGPWLSVAPEPGD